jgi:hypothetical protein
LRVVVLHMQATLELSISIPLSKAKVLSPDTLDAFCTYASFLFEP